jgi:hypothetical protein
MASPTRSIQPRLINSSRRRIRIGFSALRDLICATDGYIKRAAVAINRALRDYRATSEVLHQSNL